jgi:NAD(P)-dependent dehydrogenase (short-subunit alcohol dehydrogenase family)
MHERRRAVRLLGTRDVTDGLTAPGLGLAGATVVVTGGADGIGRGCVLAFAREGADVVAVDIDAAKAEALPEAAASLAGTVVPVVGDVRDVAVLEAAAQEATARGGLDVAVNNVGGLVGTEPTPSLDVDEASWQAVVDFNLRPTFLGCQVFARTMIAAGTAGAIVNIGASNSLRAAPQLAAYAAAKAGIVNLTQTLAVELAPHGIRVNCLAPIFTDTPSTRRYAAGERREQTAAAIPLGRVAQPDDMAGVALFLASPLARFVTGQTIVVDGGMLATTRRPPRGAGG